MSTDMSTLLVDDASPHFATLTVRPWPDPVIDALGHDPRSPYVERFWLPILGPSTTWLLRLLATELDVNPAGFELDLAEAALVLGIGSRGGRHSPFMRALTRCCRFDLAELGGAAAAELGGADAAAVGRSGATAIVVRRKLPPLNRRQLLRLPPSLQQTHREWQEATLAVPAADQLRRRACGLALSLLELGEDHEEAARQLVRWKFHPVLARESAEWAWDRHQRALYDYDDPDIEVGAPDGAA